MSLAADDLLGRLDRLRGDPGRPEEPPDDAYYPPDGIDLENPGDFHGMFIIETPRLVIDDADRPNFLAYLDAGRVPAISVLPDVGGLSGWTPVRILVKGRERSAPPSILNLLYANRRHLLFGPFGTAKTMFCAYAASVVFKRGGNVLWVSIDGGPLSDLLERFESFGVTEDQLTNQFHCLENTGQLTTQYSKWIRACASAHEYELVVVDSSMGSMNAENLDPNSAIDVDRWWNEVGDAFKGTCAAVVLIDHSGKSEETRRTSSGSHRKQDAPDVVLRLAEISNLYRATVGADVTGETRIFMEKDRPAFHRVKRGTQLGVIRFTSHCVHDTELHDDGTVKTLGRWTLDATIAWGSGDTVSATTGRKRLTWYMERVTTFLQQHGGPATKSVIVLGVGGKKGCILRAIGTLAEEGYVTVQTSSSAHLVTLVRAYLQAEDPLAQQDQADHHSEGS